MRPSLPALISCSALCLGSACVVGGTGPTDGGVGFDVTPRDGRGGADTNPVCPDSPGDVDLLFMIDNSNSMSEEQTSLAMQLPRLVRTLASGDLDLDGLPEFRPVRSLQVGVVTSDMGTGGFVVPTCTAPETGDDGILRTRGDTARSGCMGSYPRFLSFSPGTDPDAFATDVGCLARQGTGGCAFEQQLDAVLKAVTPSDSAIRFANGTRGRGDRDNDGFVRPGALLAVVVVTDEEDCSASDPGLFDPDSSTYTSAMTLRCFSYPGDPPLYPIDRYVDGLLAVKGDPRLLVYGVIAGIPTELVGTSTDYDAILSHPDMEEVVDPGMAMRLRPSCNVPGRGLAFPPRRIVRVGQGLEARGVSTTMRSICQADFTPAIDAILVRIGDWLQSEFCE